MFLRAARPGTDRGWAYKHDGTLRLPYQDNLSARLITQLGNQAVHSAKPIQATDAVVAVRELFHVGYWLARTYARQSRPEPGLTFDPERLPKTRPAPAHTLEQLQRLAADLAERDEKLAVLLADKASLDQQLQQARAELAEAKKANQAAPDTHDYSEAATRANGYDHWLWDDAHHPPRAVQGFYMKAELELAIQRRHTRKAMAAAQVDESIVERHYQTRAIRRIAEASNKTTSARRWS